MIHPSGRIGIIAQYLFDRTTHRIKCRITNYTGSFVAVVIDFISWFYFEAIGTTKIKYSELKKGCCNPLVSSLKKKKKSGSNIVDVVPLSLWKIIVHFYQLFIDWYNRITLTGFLIYVLYEEARLIFRCGTQSHSLRLRRRGSIQRWCDWRAVFETTTATATATARDKHNHKPIIKSFPSFNDIVIRQRI